MSREFDELLSAYLDGEVSPEERAAVERRLEQSPALRETLDELSEVGDLVRGLPRARAPLDLPERVVAAISKKPLASTAAPSQRSRYWRAWPLMAAGTVLAAGVAVVVLVPGPREDQRVATNEAWDDDMSLRGEGLAKAPASADGATPALTAGAAAEAYILPATPLSAGPDADFSLSPQTQSLAENLQLLGRKPQQGDVISTVVDNAGETQVLRYTVVDTREIAKTMTTIFANNSFDIVVTETPSPPVADPRSAGDHENGLVYYLEGSKTQVGQALDEIQTRPEVREVTDLGVLADMSQRTVSFFSDADSDQSRVGGLGRDDDPSPRGRDALSAESAPAQRPESEPAAAPAPLAPLARSAPGAAGSTLNFANRENDAVKPLADQKSAETRFGSTPPSDAPSRMFRASKAASVNASNALRGVSAQLDSQSAMPIVENMLRNRSQANTSQLKRNSTSGGAENSTPSQWTRQTLGETLDRGARTAAKEAERLGESKAVEAGREQAGGKQQNLGVATEEQAQDLIKPNLANPRNVPSQEEGLVKVLLILQPKPPTPAAASAPAAPSPATPIPAEPAAPTKKGD